MSFIVGNTMAEAKVLLHLQHLDGRHNYFALIKHYEGVGHQALDLIQANQDLQTLFYSGKKKPHMWWEEFETRLTTAFATYDKHEGPIVHSEGNTLCTLLNMVQADFLMV